MADDIISDWLEKIKTDPRSKLDLSNLDLDKWPKSLSVPNNDKIIKVDYSGNKTKAIPKLKNCENLTSTDGLLERVGTISKCQILILSHNKLRKLPGITKCVKVLANNNNLRELPKTISKLEILDVSNNPELENLPTKAPKLRVLIINNCNIQKLPSMPKLEVIKYHDNPNLKVKLRPSIRVLGPSDDFIVEDFVSPLKTTKKDDDEKHRAGGDVPQSIKKRTPSKGSPKVIKQSPPKKRKGLGLTSISLGKSKKKVDPTKKKTVSLAKKAAKEKEVKSGPVVGLKKKLKARKEGKGIIPSKVINVWDEVPKTFGEIKTVPIEPIRTSKISEIKPKEIEEPIMPIGKEIELVEIEVTKEIEVPKPKEKTVVFLDVFNPLSLPLPRKKAVTEEGETIRKYDSKDIEIFAISANVRYVGFTDTIKNLIYKYIKQKDLLKDMKPEDDKTREILAKNLKLRLKKGEIWNQRLIRWLEAKEGTSSDINEFLKDFNPELLLLPPRQGGYNAVTIRNYATMIGIVYKNKKVTVPQMMYVYLQEKSLLEKPLREEEDEIRETIYNVLKLKGDVGESLNKWYLSKTK